MKVIATGQPLLPLTDDGLTCHAAHTIKLAPDALFYPLGTKARQEPDPAPSLAAPWASPAATE